MSSEPWTFDDYQESAARTAIYPGAGTGEDKAIVYNLLGLSNETGELLGKYKKVMRDDLGLLSEEKRQDLKAEAGDVLWYLSNLLGELGFRLDEVADANISKLNSRKERGVLGGSGDNR